MIDEDLDWMSFHEAVTYVEVTLHCYRGMARQLLRKAVNNMKVKTSNASVADVARVGYCWTGSNSFRLWRKRRSLPQGRR